MFFPYKDDNPTEITPTVTVGIIALNVIVWIVFQGAGSAHALAASTCQWGLTPGEILRSLPPGVRTPLGQGFECLTTSHPNYLTVFTSMFLHGSWLHILGNMWFLWIFGNNIEDAMGHFRYLVFYLLSGVAAAAAQTLSNTHSAVPMIGASGAISGVMGAYLVLFPKVKVHTLVFLGFFFTTIAVPAYLMLVWWFLVQFLSGLPALGGQSDTGGVAVFAHMGGFIAGLVLVKAFLRRGFRRA
ncbi:MAG TPA: rhomboid family intramembrane serine protease [Gemmatimonadales bacterium]|jgi:membrane associated rhomboid family serine protease|nr:rhomboid family intramembrane serine protease [Gemmatimonadales bacterium]